MTHAPGQADLFRHQPGLFDALPPAPPAEFQVNMANVRRRLQATLDTLRAARRLPWAGETLRLERLLFHNVSTWLPEPEREATRQAFLAELERLEAAG